MAGRMTPASSSRTTAEFAISDADGTVHVRKRVSKGERLEIDSGEDRVKLDSLLLEGISWQGEQEVLDEVMENSVATETVPTPPDEDDPAEDREEISISNEYSHTVVRKHTTDAGEALCVEAPGRGTSTNLGARTLRKLAAVSDTYVFSGWFSTPFGPEDAPLEGPI